ncbi:PQQ-binding-like beta-propeller repeat protein, partial [Natronospira sp.]
GVSSDGSYVVIGDDRDVRIIDGDSGRIITTLGDDFWQRLARHSRIAGVSLSEFMADSYRMTILDEARVMLLFDYRLDDEIVTAIDLDSGRELWRNDQLAFSLEKYGIAIRAAGRAAGQALGRLLGADHQEETREDRLHRQHEYFSRLVIADPNGEDFLFKTYHGLFAINARSGQMRWHLPEFSGAGLGDVIELPDGDRLIMGGGSNLMAVNVASNHHIARVSPSGDVRWMSEYSGSRVAGMQVAEQRVIVDASPLEVFDLESGRKLWEVEIERSPVERPAPIVADGHLYHATTSIREGSRLIQTRVPFRISKYELDSGRKIWRTDNSDTTFTHIKLAGDRILASGFGDLFDGNGGLAAFTRADGRLDWSSPEFGRRGMLSTGLHATAPRLSGERVFIAGPEHLYAFQLEDGRLLFAGNLDDADVGGIHNLILHGDTAVVVGRGGAAGFSQRDGRLLFAGNPLTVHEHHHHGSSLVLEQKGRTGGAVLLDLDAGEFGPIMRYRRFTDRLFGDFDGRIFVSRDGRQVMTINGNGDVSRYTL